MTIKAIAYRGEHGLQTQGHSFQSRLASLSFGSLETAKTYAKSPNNRDDVVHTPKVMKVHLTIKRPVMNNENDPFIDFPVIRDALGVDKALKIAFEQEDHLNNTDNFLELLEDNDAGSLKELHEILGDDVLDDLYMDAYPVFDNKDYVQWFQEAGYDGAVHGGNGVSAMEAEYKVFDPINVRILKVFDLTAKAAEPAFS